MALFTKPKPAGSFIHDGTITGATGLMTWIQSKGLEFNSASVEMGSDKLWVVRISYYKPQPEGMIPMYKNAVLTKGIQVIVEGSDDIFQYQDETALLVDFDQSEE